MPSRRGRSGSASGRGRRSRFEEEEEGYGSGEYDEGPYELVKIRVKVCVPSLRYSSYKIREFNFGIAPLCRRYSWDDFESRNTL